jgi:hypothetical protein
MSPLIVLVMYMIIYDVIIIIIIVLLRFKVHDIFGETPRPDGKISTAPLIYDVVVLMLF